MTFHNPETCENGILYLVLFFVAGGRRVSSAGLDHQRPEPANSTIPNQSINQSIQLINYTESINQSIQV